VTAELFVEPFWLVATAAVWLTLAIGFVTWIRRRSGPAERWSYPFLIIASAGTVLLAVLVSIFKPLIVARYFIGVLPAFCLLLAYPVVYARPRGLALGLGISILVVSLMSGSMVVTRQTTENWKAVAAHIEANSSSGDDLVLIDQAQVWSVPFDFYYRGELEAGFMSGELSDAQTVQDAVDANCPCDRLWLVQSVRRTSGESLVYEPQSDYGGYKILARKTFHENLIRDRLAIDLWLLGEEGN
jgi:hypothetical protein